MFKNIRTFSKRKKLFVAPAIVVGCLIFLFVFNRFALNSTQNAFYFISSPLQKISWRAGQTSSGFLGSFFKAVVLQKENQALMSQNFLLKQQLLELKNLNVENAQLRKAMELGLAEEFDLILANVLSKQLEKDVILIDKGQKHGIAKGMPVITEEKVLVGVVGEVFSRFAKVELISSVQNSFSVEIEPIFSAATTTFAQTVKPLGIAKGLGAFKASFNMVPEEAAVKIGDLVLTSSLDNQFLPGLLLGEVESVSQSATQPFQEGLIKVYFKQTDWRALFIVKNYVLP